MKLFNERPISVVFQETFGRAINEVHAINEYGFNKENLQNLTTEIYNVYKEKSIEVDFTKKSARVEMEQISGKYFPADYDVNRNQNYPCAKVVWTFKIIKGSKFLDTFPKNNSFKPINVYVDRGNNLLEVYYQTLYAREELSDQIKQEVKSWIADLVPKIENTISLINDEISEFNNAMKNKVEEEIIKRVKEIEKKNQQNDDLADF
ncbi:MAG: hypothetical protein V2I33_26120 [Kangiellaceae bacterium]|jgi:hypothetical protein|nr:hypothetical protein [Kangiellaceae bacterium]